MINPYWTDMDFISDGSSFHWEHSLGFTELDKLLKLCHKIGKIERALNYLSTHYDPESVLDAFMVLHDKRDETTWNMSRTLGYLGEE